MAYRDPATNSRSKPQRHLATRTGVRLEQQLAHGGQKTDVTHFRRDILPPPTWRLGWIGWNRFHWSWGLPRIEKQNRNLAHYVKHALTYLYNKPVPFILVTNQQIVNRNQTCRPVVKIAHYDQSYKSTRANWLALIKQGPGLPRTGSSSRSGRKTRLNQREDPRKVGRGPPTYPLHRIWMRYLPPWPGGGLWVKPKQTT